MPKHHIGAEQHVACFSARAQRLGNGSLRGLLPRVASGGVIDGMREEARVDAGDRTMSGCRCFPWAPSSPRPSSSSLSPMRRSPAVDSGTAPLTFACARACTRPAPPGPSSPPGSGISPGSTHSRSCTRTQCSRMNPPRCCPGFRSSASLATSISTTRIALDSRRFGDVCVHTSTDTCSIDVHGFVHTTSVAHTVVDLDARAASARSPWRWPTRRCRRSRAAPPRSPTCDRSLNPRPTAAAAHS